MTSLVVPIRCNGDVQEVSIALGKTKNSLRENGYFTSVTCAGQKECNLIENSAMFSCSHHKLGGLVSTSVVAHKH